MTYAKETMQLTQNMRIVLTNLIGKRLETVKTNQPLSGDYLGAVGLFFDDNTAIQIENKMMVKNYYNTSEDVGVLTVTKIMPEQYISKIPNGKVITYAISELIENVKIIVDHISDTTDICKYDATIDIAIVFELATGVLVFEKGWKFMEYINIHESPDYMSKLRNAYDDWHNDEDNNHPICERTVESLSCK